MDLAEKFGIKELQRDSSTLIDMDYLNKHKFKPLVVGGIYGIVKSGILTNLTTNTKDVFSVKSRALNSFGNTFGIHIPKNYIVVGVAVIGTGFIIYELAKSEEFKEKYGDLVAKIVLVSGIGLMILIAIS